MPTLNPTRRDILKGAAALGVAAAFSRLSKLNAADATALLQPKAGAPKYNVLFLMSDDMRPELSCFGNALNKTPNIDALAKAGVMFERGYCQFPLCCPSRSSMLTGRHVFQTGVYGNNTFFGDIHPELVSLPKYFKQHGYATLRTGKIFHFDDGDAWTEGGVRGGSSEEADAIPNIPNARAQVFGQAAPAAAAASTAATPATPDRATIMQHNRQLGSSAGFTKAQYSDRTIALEDDGEGHGDYATADRAIDYLRRYKDQSFFLGCGFVKPHSPPTAPQKFYDQLPLDKIQLPVDFAAKRTLPEGFPEGCLRPRNADLFIGRDATPEQAKAVIQAYFASIAWVDWNIGRVIAELDRLGLREKTIICFSADHGYQLGEKGKWSKAGSLWEEGARIPMFIAVPGAKGNGTVCKRPVETLNFYPTLVELCNLPMPAGQEGRSMTALLDNPKAEWDHPAHTVWSEDGKTFTGIGVRIERWRYAEYDLGGAMLLDMDNDPHQLKNLVHDPQYADVAKKMAGYVQEYRNMAKTAMAAPVSPVPAAPVPATTAPAIPAAPSSTVSTT